MYLTFDIGTSSVKAALVGADGRASRVERAPVGLYRGDGDSAWEAEPSEWWHALAECSRRLVTDAPGQIRAVAVSGNGPTLVPADKRGKPVGRAISWMDRRARDQADRISALMGFPLDPSFYLPKVLWFRENRPEEFERTSRFFSCPEWIAFRLSGEACTYLTDPYYERYTWGGNTASDLGLDASRFPPYTAPGRILGGVLPDASRDTGIPEGTPVVSAFPDFLASLLGSGAVEPGIACDRAGTSEAFNVCAPAPCADWSFLSLPHAVPGLWNISGGLSTSGKALEWYARAAGFPPDDESGARKVFRAAESSVPGAGNLLFLPFLAGERAPLWRRDLRGAFLGLSVDHGPEDLARAVAESIGFGLRLTSQGLADRGHLTSLVRVSGRPARNTFLSRLKADILGLPVEVPELPDCELLGNAAACAVALGDGASLAEAAARLVRVESRFEPEPGTRQEYDRLFGIFADAVESLIPLSERLTSDSKTTGGYQSRLGNNQP